MGLLGIFRNARCTLLIMFLLVLGFSIANDNSGETSVHQDPGVKTESEDSPKDTTTPPQAQPDGKDGEEKIGGESAKAEDTPTGGSISPEEIYLHLFKQKRKSQKDAVNSVLAMGDYQKQYKMIQLLLDKVFKVITQARVALMESGFIPGDPFPTNESIRDAFSNIVENTAFFGDILLRLPDITHDILNRNNEGLLTVRWGFGFCNDTNIFKEGNDATLLHLVAQELGIVERDPNYVNPYKQNTDKLQKKLEEEAFGKADREKKKKEKKKKEKKKKGPRLSGMSHTEL